MPLDCDVTFNGLERDCTGSVGGLKALWFTNRSAISNLGFDTKNPAIVNKITVKSGEPFKKYGIQPQTSSFTTTVGYDIATGTQNYETAIEAVFVGMTGEKNAELQKFATGAAVAIAKDSNSRYWLIGIDNYDDDYALEMADGSTATTGAARSDMNGYTLNLVHYTNHYPYELSSEAVLSLGLYPLSGGGSGL